MLFFLCKFDKNINTTLIFVQKLVKQPAEGYLGAAQGLEQGHQKAPSV